MITPIKVVVAAMVVLARPPPHQPAQVPLLHHQPAQVPLLRLMELVLAALGMKPNALMASHVDIQTNTSDALQMMSAAGNVKVTAAEGANSCMLMYAVALTTRQPLEVESLGTITERQ